jgi:hypothetical protein
MSIIQSENKAHSATCFLSEAARQSDVAKAKATFVAGGTQTAYDAATRASDIAHYQRVQASAIANGLQSACFQEALWALGAGPI